MKNENICIICIDVAFANASIIQKTLDCNIVAEKIDAKGYSENLTQNIRSLNDIPKAQHYIFAGSGILTRIDVSKLKGRKSVIISDSHYLRKTEEIDCIIEDNKIEVHCMIDLWDFCRFKDKKAYIHPFEEIDIDTTKNNRITASHSPYSEYKKSLKGTNNVISAISGVRLFYNIGLDIIVDKSWKECLEIKSKSDIFIDQICDKTHTDNKLYQGGIGKSGLEGMLLKCLTFSSGKKVLTDIEFPPFEIVNSSSELCNRITYFLDNRIKMISRIKEQYSWAKKYTNPIYVLNKILKNE